MKKVRRSVVVVVAIGVFSVAAFADFVVTGSGVANGSDQNATDSSALNQAQNQANAICPTYTTNMQTTSDNCISIGSGDNATMHGKR